MTSTICCTCFIIPRMAALSCSSLTICILRRPMAARIFRCLGEQPILLRTSLTLIIISSCYCCELTGRSTDSPSLFTDDDNRNSQNIVLKRSIYLQTAVASLGKYFELVVRSTLTSGRWLAQIFTPLLLSGSIKFFAAHFTDIFGLAQGRKPLNSGAKHIVRIVCTDSFCKHV